MEGRERGVRILIGGDFNARSGDEEGKVEGEEWEESRYKRSKDKKINGEGRRLRKNIRKCMKGRRRRRMRDGKER